MSVQNLPRKVHIAEAARVYSSAADTYSGILMPGCNLKWVKLQVEALPAMCLFCSCSQQLDCIHVAHTRATAAQDFDA